MSLRILIITSDKAFGASLADSMTADGHHVSCILSVAEIKGVGLRPELILLELAAEGGGAIETMSNLQKARAARQVPVIVISSFPELEYELLNVFDFICKPVNLTRLRQDIEVMTQGGRRRILPLEPLRDKDYRMFYDYLVDRSGLHFERRNMKVLERGIINRMTTLKIDTYPEYYDFLIRYQESRQELQKLLQLLTVGETYFFRFRVHFEALKKFLKSEPVIRGGKKLRIWSAGCSTGEEAYSIAMSVMEALPDWRERDIRILATDINKRALRIAKDGIYRSWAMRVTEQRHLDRFFERDGEQYLIKDEVKKLVDFSHLNLQTATFPARTGEFRDIDAIFCRNVMIYFNTATTEKIIKKFFATLNPEGYLFLGHAEALSQNSMQFERHMQSGGFYYRKRSAAQLSCSQREAKHFKTRKPPIISKPPTEKPFLVPRVPGTEQPADTELLYQKARLHFEAEKFAEASQLLEEILRRQPDHVGAMITRGFILANKGDFAESLAMCRKALAIDDLVPEAYFLKGLLLDLVDEPAEAVTEYRKAILLNMDFVMPHYHLGRLLVRLGKAKDGMRELRNSFKIVERNGENSIIPYSGGLSRETILERLRHELVAVGE